MMIPPNNIHNQAFEVTYASSRAGELSIFTCSHHFSNKQFHLFRIRNSSGLIKLSITYVQAFATALALSSEIPGDPAFGVCLRPAHEWDMGPVSAGHSARHRRNE
jgi:hypothetical protein